VSFVACEVTFPIVLYAGDGKGVAGTEKSGRING